MNAATQNSLALPVFLLALAFFLLTAFQCQQLMIDHSALKRAHAAQEEGVKQSKLIQEKLDAIATGTLELAEKGNKNARAIVENMKARGITINPKKDDAAAVKTDQPPPAVAAPVPPSPPTAPPQP